LLRPELSSYHGLVARRLHPISVMGLWPMSVAVWSLSWHLMQWSFQCGNSAMSRRELLNGDKRSQD